MPPRRPPSELWLSLPAEVVPAAIPDATALVRMLQTCKAWRTAIKADEEKLWKAFAMADFPRLHDILRLQPPPPVATAGFWRDTYRSQFRAKTTPVQCAPTSPTTSWSDYVFTVEVSAAGQEAVSRSFIINSWTELADLEAPWGRAEERPEWLKANPVHNIHGLQLSFLVTFQHRTIRLYDKGTMKDDALAVEPLNDGLGTFYEPFKEQSLPFGHLIDTTAFATGDGMPTVQPWMELSPIGFEAIWGEDDYLDEDGHDTRELVDTFQLNGQMRALEGEVFLPYLQSIPWDRL